MLHTRENSIYLAKGQFPLDIVVYPDGWIFVTCRTIPGLMLAGKDLNILKEEALLVGPLLLKLNRQPISASPPPVSPSPIPAPHG